MLVPCGNAGSGAARAHHQAAGMVVNGELARALDEAVVNGAYKLLGWGLIPLGAPAGGLVAHTFGLRAPYPVAGVLRGVALPVAMPVLIRAIRDQ